MVADGRAWVAATDQHPASATHTSPAPKRSGGPFGALHKTSCAGNPRCSMDKLLTWGGSV
jgi:hypothetical protein